MKLRNQSHYARRPVQRETKKIQVSCSLRRKFIVGVVSRYAVVRGSLIKPAVKEGDRNAKEKSNATSFTPELVAHVISIELQFMCT
jgi:hypothetical protein